MPVDGTFPSGTAAFEKRNIADTVPVWETDLCVQCGQCSFVCPHSVIRAKYYHEDGSTARPAIVQIGAGQRARLSRTRASRLQFYVEDCTGCGLCVEACPQTSPREPDVKAINMADKAAAADGGARATSRSLKRCRSTTARAWISPMCAACSSWSRCSSSPAPAPAAARRRTSSC